MKTFQGAFHLNYDYSTWYGYAKLKKDLTEIKELAAEMRAGWFQAGTGPFAHSICQPAVLLVRRIPVRRTSFS